MSAPWITHPLVLQGSSVVLVPLQEGHFEELFQVASDTELWELTSVDYSAKEVFYPNFHRALKDRDDGIGYAFAIVERSKHRIIGTTRFLEVHAADKKLEIGVTWIAKEFWGSSINQECKYLLLNYCFEILHVNRVQFRTKADNLRSRRALEKIGATFEGVHRKDKIEPNGNARDTAFYSVTNADWPSVQAALRSRLGATMWPNAAGFV
jgi:RimJ/RimL family protein N-acetyltransferase